MIDVIKKTILAGIGATVTSKEKVEATLNDLVQKGKISTTEAKEVAEKLAGDGKKEFEDTCKNLNEQFENVLQRAKFATQSQIEALEKRVEELEEKVNKLGD